MHIVCPHCQNVIELVAVEPGAELSCAACGSSFTLTDGSTTGWDGSAGTTIGRFAILHTVGQGAFGTVYRAHDPKLDRTVAVKMPRRGNVGDGPADVDRFLREARSAAQLRHPSIVAVHEVGVRDGSPYLVSDFVEGVTLADLLTARRPAPREAAALVATVADALQHAHAQGVVHRDVKPSNIMVRPDGSPVVMDFGLAKREAGEVTMTVDGQVLGTPAYMSPEQARGEGHRVDGRSDVFSLGVVLYKLLTGELPFRGSPRMLLHQVLHDDPKPPRGLNDRLPRDLDTICLKAMAREPARRYATAKELADDLQRFLAGEPIRARPVQRAERAWRWAKRNPAVAGLSATLGMVIVGSLLGLTFLYLRARDQRGVAETNFARADRERVRAEEADEKTQRELEKAQALSGFLVRQWLAAPRDQDLRAFNKASAPNSLGANVTLRETLDDAVPKIGPTFGQWPELEAEVRLQVGKTYQNLGELEKAVTQLRAAVGLYRGLEGPDGHNTLVATSDLALVLKKQSKLDEAEPLLRQVVDGFTRAHGPDYQAARTCTSNLAMLLLEMGQPEEAERLLRANRAANHRTDGPAHPRSLISGTNLVVVLYQTQGPRAATDLADELFRTCAAAHGPDGEVTRRLHAAMGPSYAIWLNSWSLDLTADERDAEAEAALRRALPEAVRAWGPDHPETLTMRFNLAFTLRDQKKLAEAEEVGRAVLQACRKKPAADGETDLPKVISFVGWVLTDAGKWADAEPLLREALELRRKRMPAGHPATGFTASVLGACLTGRGRYAEAEPLVLEGYAAVAASDLQARRKRECQARVVALYEAWGKPDRAAEWKATPLPAGPK